MAGSAQLACQTLLASGPPAPVTTDHYQRAWFQDMPQSFRSAATQIDSHSGFYGTRTGYDAKLPLGEIGWNGRTVERKRVWDNLGNDQRNAGAQATGESTCLP